MAALKPQDRPSARFDFTTAAEAVDVLVAGAEFFRRFMVHIDGGVQDDQDVDIKVSLNGTDFPVLLTAIAATVNGAPGVVFQFELQTIPRNGMKIAFANNAAGGKIHVMMYENPSYIARHQN